MSYTLRIEIPGLPKTANQLLRGHWRARNGHAKLWKQRVSLALIGRDKPPKPLVGAKVKFTRHSSVEPDTDNLITSFKSVRDGLVLNEIIRGDSPRDATFFYSWEYAPRNKGFVSVEVSGEFKPKGEDDE